MKKYTLCRSDDGSAVTCDFLEENIKLGFDVSKVLLPFILASSIFIKYLTMLWVIVNDMI